MKKRTILAGCVAMAVALIFTSCSNPGSSAAAGTEAATTTRPPAAQAPSGLINPAAVKDDAGQLGEAALLDLFRSQIYPNGADVHEWLINYSGTTLNYDENTVLEGGTDTATYVLVTNLDNMAVLKATLEATFSTHLLESRVYPQYFDNDTPKFVEKDGRLYGNRDTGGADVQHTDFARATVTEITPDSFTVNVPMTNPDDTDAATYAYKVVQQNGYWVLDTFYFLDPNELPSK